MNIDKDKLKSMRKKTGLNQKDFAERIGVSKVYIGMMECGMKPVSYLFLKKMAKVFKISIKLDL